MKGVRIGVETPVGSEARGLHLLLKVFVLLKSFLIAHQLFRNIFRRHRFSVVVVACRLVRT